MHQSGIHYYSEYMYDVNTDWKRYKASNEYLWHILCWKNQTKIIFLGELKHNLSRDMQLVAMIDNTGICYHFKSLTPVFRSMD